MNYQVKSKFKPLLLLIDILGYLIFTPFLIFKRFKPKNIKKILVIRIDEIGDVLLTTPVFRALKKRFPNAELNVLVKPSTKILLKDNPNIDRIIVCKKPWLKNKLNLFYFMKLIENLRKKRFDLVVELHTDPRNILLAFLIGTYAIGYGFRGFGFLLNKRAKYKRRHITKLNMDLVGLVGADNKSLDMDIFVGKKEMDLVNRLLKEHSVGKRLLVCINPGAGRPNKLWRNEKWAELTKNLIKNYSAKIIFTGNIDEKPIINEIIDSINDKSNIINLTGKLNLLQLAALIKKCNLFIGPDTGPMHIARAVKTPLIGLFGPVDPKVWGYNEKKYKSIYKKLGCSFCDQPNCIRKGQKNLCMKRITVNDVLREFRTIKNEIK